MDKNLAAAYVRMSTDRQEDSPRQQRIEIEKLAKREGCEIVEWYRDEGITGDSIDQRPGFSRMLNDAQLGRFEVVLCDNQDRFGRFDSIDAGMVISPLRKAGVRMLTNAQGWIDWNDFAGRMMYAIQSEGKHQFLVDLSRNILRSYCNSDRIDTYIKTAPRGMCRVFYDQHGEQQLRVASGDQFKRPKGWTVRLAPSDNVNEREAIRWAFEQYATTPIGLTKLCESLQERGVLSRTGQPLSPTTVKGLLTNKKYIGVVEVGTCVRGKYHRMDSDGNVARASAVPATGSHRRSPIKVIDNAGEPLISAKIFDAVQRKLRHRRAANRKCRPNVYILSGVLICGHCGGPMHGRCHAKESRYYYRCDGRRKGKCQGYNVRCEPVDEFAVSLLVKMATANGRVGEQVKLAIGERERGSEGQRIGNQLTAIESKLSRVRRNMLLADDEELPTARLMVEEFKAHRDALLAEQSDIDTCSGEQLESEIRLMIESGDQLLNNAPRPILKHAIAEAFESITISFKPRGKRQVLAAGNVRIRRG